MKSQPPWNVSREMLVRREAETDPSYGKPPHQRSVDELLRLGVINLDKQRGPTSHEVAYIVKKILEINQAGHGGTLEAFGEIPLSPASCP
ncbi:MAG: hypothetical protein QXR26_00475 [Candidatus Caldarchaeum sp.]